MIRGRQKPKRRPMRKTNIARGDTLYEAIMHSCHEYAMRIYRDTVVREGVIATQESLSNYYMGFTDAVYAIVTGELGIATVERTMKGPNDAVRCTGCEGTQQEGDHGEAPENMGDDGESDIQADA